MCLFTIVHSVKMLMLINVLNSKFFYASAKSSEHQICMIKNKCFDCSQKKHIQKSCLTYLFEKIHLLLNLKINWSMNFISQTDVKINIKSSANSVVKIMKLIIKFTVKSVTNMNTCINLSKNTQIVFMKKIHIVFSVTSWITSSSKLKNELFWNQVTFQNIIKKNLWCVYAF